MIHKNYFSKLGFQSLDFDITEKQINEKYFNQQKLYHPDRPGANIRESAELNEAYCNLVDPLARAQHIFELNKIDILSGPVNLRIFEMLSDAENNYRTSFEQMKIGFKEGDLDKAYKAWCACQYLKRFCKENSA